MEKVSEMPEASLVGVRQHAGNQAGRANQVWHQQGRDWCLHSAGDLTLMTVDCTVQEPLGRNVWYEAAGQTWELGRHRSAFLDWIPVNAMVTPGRYLSAGKPAHASLGMQVGALPSYGPVLTVCTVCDMARTHVAGRA